MIYFTGYANSKFELLNKHKVYFRREQVEDAVASPAEVKKRGKNYFIKKDGVGTVYRKEDGCVKIITFYPVK